MSTYTSSTTTVTAVTTPTNAQLIRRVIADHVADPLTTPLDSRRLRAMVDDEVRLDIDARWDRLRETPNVLSVVRSAEPTLLDGVSRRIAERRRALSSGDGPGARRLADEAGTVLDRALEGAADRLAVEERVVVAEASERGLGSRGFTVARHDRTSVSGLWAVRGDQAVAIAVGDGGTVTTDVAGCAAGACETVMAELVEALSEQGVTLEVHRDDAHDDEAGGALIRRAASAHARSMAEGIAEVGERLAPDPVPHRRPRRTNRIGRA
jgi:hypothetical protein